LSNILRDKPTQQKKALIWTNIKQVHGLSLVIISWRFDSQMRKHLSEKHFAKTGEYMTSRGIAKLTGFNPANIKNMLQHKRSVVKKCYLLWKN
jgi:hypothetical protein